MVGSGNMGPQPILPTIGLAPSSNTYLAHRSSTDAESNEVALWSFSQYELSFVGCIADS